MNDVKSLSHSKWRCKYHIVFAPKYRRQIIYGQIKEDIGKILRSLCNRKQVELIEGECCPDHIHILVAIPPHLSVSQFMGYVNVLPPIEAGASCFNENSATDSKELRRLTLSPQAWIPVRPTVFYGLRQANIRLASSRILMAAFLSRLW